MTLNNDMVQEVKVQSSNFAAEHGAGGMNVSAVTKSGSSQFHGSLYVYNRDSKFAANDRSNSIAGVDKPKSKFNYYGGNVGGPVLLPGFNKDRNKMFFFAGLEVQRQMVDSGARFGVVPTLKQRTGDFSELLTSNGQNLRQTAGPVYIPGGSPGAGTPAPGNDLSPYITPDGRVLANLYPAPNYIECGQPVQLRATASSSRPTASISRPASTTTSAATPRPTSASRARVKTVEGARGVWWGASEVALPSPNLGENVGRSVRRQRRLGAEPDDDQRGARQLEPPDARQHLQGSVEDDAGGQRHLDAGAVRRRQPVHPGRRSRTGAAA